MIYGLFIIFLFLTIGNYLSTLIGGFIPGSVIGMLLLFVALLLKIVKADDIRSTANVFSQNMALFFLPAGVGVITAVAILEKYWASILISSIVSTVLIIIVVAWVQQKMEKWKQ
jgi:Putative effector of murein hydrolase LrgA